MYSHTHTLTHSHTHSHTHSLTHKRTHTHTHTRSLTHSLTHLYQAITVKLTHDVPLEEVEQAIASHNEWVCVVPNNKVNRGTSLIRNTHSRVITIGL